jgi:hypothetical protein
LIRLDVLEALDGLQWLRTGDEVARHFPISQATVTRHCSKVLSLLDLQLERRNGEWELLGDQTLLRMEREVHQLARLRGLRPLRLEATYWSASSFCDALPPGWTLGPSNIVGVPRNHLLLQERIVDGWVAGLPDLPTASHPDLTATVLSRMPVFFTCAPDHPLRERRCLSYSDIAAYPTLALPAGSYPRVEAALKAIGLWNDGVRMTRYQRDRWEGRSEEDLVVGYGTPLSMRTSGGSLCRLPLLLPFSSGDALVTLREHHQAPRLQELLGHLHGRLRELAQQEPEIELMPLP